MILCVRDHSSITSSKRWVGVVKKWQFLMIYSTVNHQSQKHDDVILEWSLNQDLLSPQQICIGKWFDSKEDNIKFHLVVWLYGISLFGHILFNICIAVEKIRKRLDLKKVNPRCQTPITSFGTLGTVWLRKFLIFSFVGGISIAER